MRSCLRLVRCMFLSYMTFQDEAVTSNLNLASNLLQVLTESVAELEPMQPSPEIVILINDYRNMPLGGATNQDLAPIRIRMCEYAKELRRTHVTGEAEERVATIRQPDRSHNKDDWAPPATRTTPTQHLSLNPSRFQRRSTQSSCDRDTAVLLHSKEPQRSSRNPHRDPPCLPQLL